MIGAGTDGPLVDLANVSKDYPLGKFLVKALRGVDLTIERSRFVVVAGPSGSGKSTLLNLVGCIDHPTSGSVHIGGRPVDSLSDLELSRFRAHNLGFIFQSFNLIPVLTAYENVEYPLRLKQTPRDKMRRLTLEMLDAVGLADQSRQRPNALSGGQQQRVAVARALVTEPKLVLADEPTANLDSGTGERIIDLMKAMQDRLRTTFVVATHDPMIAARAERRITLRDGSIVEDWRAKGGDTQTPKHPNTQGP